MASDSSVSFQNYFVHSRANVHASPLRLLFLHEWYHTVHTASIVFCLKVSRRLVFIICRGWPHTFLRLNEWQSIARVTMDDHSLSNQFLVLGIYIVSSLWSKRVTAVSNLPCVLHMCLSVCRASSQRQSCWCAGMCISKCG